MGVQTDDLLAQLGELRSSIADDRKMIANKWSHAEALVSSIVDGQHKRKKPQANLARQVSTAMALLVLPIVLVGSFIGWTYGSIIFVALTFLVIQGGIRVLTMSTKDKPPPDWIL